MPVVCSLQNPIPGVTVDANSCVVSVAGSFLTAGQYFVNVIKTNTDLSPTDPNYETVCPVAVNVSDPTLHTGCNDPVVFIGCDGQPLPVGFDAFGNPAVIVCCDCEGVETMPCVVHEYSLAADGGPSAAACTTTCGYAYNTDDGCFTHICYNGAWRPWCSDTTVDPINQPVFLSTPTDFCVDSTTGDVTQCWEVQDGTVTGFRWRTVQPLGPWNTI